MKNIGQMKNQPPQPPALQEPHGRLMIHTLQHFEDAAETADAAREQPVIITLQSEEENQRILDFLAGAAYAMQGAVYRVSSRVYLIAPEGVEVTD